MRLHEEYNPDRAWPVPTFWVVKRSTIVASPYWLRILHGSTNQPLSPGPFARARVFGLHPLTRSKIRRRYSIRLTVLIGCGHRSLAICPLFFWLRPSKAITLPCPIWPVYDVVAVHLVHLVHLAEHLQSGRCAMPCMRFYTPFQMSRVDGSVDGSAHISELTTCSPRLNRSIVAL